MHCAALPARPVRRSAVTLPSWHHHRVCVSGAADRGIIITRDVPRRGGTRRLRRDAVRQRFVTLLLRALRSIARTSSAEERRHPAVVAPPPCVGRRSRHATHRRRTGAALLRCAASRVKKRAPKHGGRRRGSECKRVASFVGGSSTRASGPRHGSKCARALRRRATRRVRTTPLYEQASAAVARARGLFLRLVEAAWGSRRRSSDGRTRL